MLENSQINLDKAVTHTWLDEVKVWLPSIIMLPLMIWLALNRGNYTLIDNADLVIHEAGHAVFMFLGKFIYTAGGSLMQVILPSIIAWYFLSKSYRTGLQVSLLWLGQNLINVSVYAADAQAQMLPLLGGNKVYHDWHYLLDEIGILQYDAEVGYVIFGLAILVFLISLLLPLIIRN